VLNLAILHAVFAGFAFAIPIQCVPRPKVQIVAYKIAKCFPPNFLHKFAPKVQIVAYKIAKCFPDFLHKFAFKVLNGRFSQFLEMTRVKTLTRVINFLFESSLSPAKNAKRLESDSDESLTRPNTSVCFSFCLSALPLSLLTQAAAAALS
jgi:hypothetical protein